MFLFQNVSKDTFNEVHLVEIITAKNRVTSLITRIGCSNTASLFIPNILTSCLLHPSTSTSWPDPGVLETGIQDPDSKLVHEDPREEVPHGSRSLDNTNRCKPNTSFVWCLPQDYNQEKHPFTCKSVSSSNNIFLLRFSFQIFIW